MAERIVHVAHTCGCTLLRVGVSGPAQCPTHDRLTEALGRAWPSGALWMRETWGDSLDLSDFDEGPRPSTHGQDPRRPR